MFVKNWLIVIFFLVLVGGCSTKVAYNYLDWGIQWKVRSLVSLNSNQKQKTKLAAIAFHDWHRANQLSQYADYLLSLQQRVNQGPISADEIHAETDKVQNLLDQSIDQVIPDIANVLSDINDKQAKELLQSFAEERKDYIKDYVDITPKQQIKKRYKELKDYITPWFGSLNKTQKQQLKKWSETLEPYEELSAQQQITWEQQFKQLLDKRTNTQNLTAGLHKLMFYRTDDWDPKLEAILDRNQDHTYAFLSSLLEGATKKQRHKMNKKFNYYIRICQELSQERNSKDTISPYLTTHPDHHNASAQPAE